MAQNTLEANQGGLLPDQNLDWAPVLLRPLRPEDADDRLRAGRVAEFVHMCGGDPRDLPPMTAEQAQGWYARLSGEPHCFAIQVEGRCVGHVLLHHVEAADRRGRLAIGIFDPACWGRGIGTLATRLMLRHAFEMLRLHRVDLRVLEYNARAIACYEQCGFRHEGLERESACVLDAWHSDVIMGILEHEYAALAPAWWREPDRA
jgi:[ribosomal protein S5]-alanine N-acetyltransferase